MLLFEVIGWMWEHKGEITINGILLLILRKFILAEIHKTIHFGREEELTWILTKVEALTGETYSHQPILKQVQTRYIKRFYSYLLVVSKRVYQLRRERKMTQINYVTLLTAILGACKLILQPMGIEIPDAQLNAIVNGAAAILTIVGIFMNHRKQTTTTGVQQNGFGVSAENNR